MADARTWQRALGVGALTIGLLVAQSPVGTADDVASVVGTAQSRVFGPEAAVKLPGRSSAPKESVTITLLTGDKVTLLGGDADTLSIEPAGGDASRMFHQVTYRKHRYVIPSDVSGLIASNRLDRQLFDITSLVDFEYDDAHVDSVPLLVSYDDQDARKRLTRAGAQPGRKLPAIRGAAFEVDKNVAEGFLAGLSGTSRRLGPGVRRIWLNGKAQLDLHESAPQIGAPTAWGLGFTGQGVEVAVLDSGIDETHPDLVGKVVLQKDFTGNGSSDVIGHGTHVAGTIAGTGAASSGKYTGIAPDATLLDGKICEISCTFDAVLAGMEWASAQGADVVNMSLGAYDTGGIDPFEEAVNRLTAENGTLFVCASGNDFGDGFVNSPSSADAALAVGAVSKSDDFAPFSNAGPSADGGIKPDITAPGVNIVAALSGDAATSPILGPPIDGVYTALGGTSMATPHVAGAAALVKSQHPAWTPAEIKAALMSTALPNPDIRFFQQGAGRVDVGRAVTQPVVAEQGSINFGEASFPHGDDVPVDRQLTYRNLGDQDVTLDVIADMAGPDGEPVPDGAISVSDPTVTVPAGGTASVTVTSDTSHDGQPGIYTGRVTATAPGVRVGVPVAVSREYERYNLTIEATDRDGDPAAFDAIVNGINVFLFENVVRDDGTSVTLRVPPGSYSIDAIVTDLDGPDEGYLAQPITTVEGDMVWRADLADAKPVAVHVSDPGARNELSAFLCASYFFDEGSGQTYPTFTTSGVIVPGTFDHFYLGQVDDNQSAQFTVWCNATVTLNVPTADGDVFTLFDEQPDLFWDGFERTYSSSELAGVDHRFHASGPGHFFAAQLIPYSGREGIGTIVPQLSVDSPSHAVWWLSPSGPGTPLVGWSEYVDEYAPLEVDGVVQPVHVTQLFGNPGKHDVVGDWIPLKAGSTHVDHWNVATLGPRTTTVNHLPDALIFDVRMGSDAGGHDAFIATDDSRTALYRDGELIEESPYPGSIYLGGDFTGRSQFRLDVDLTRSFSEFSSRQSASWRFWSRDSEGGAGPVAAFWTAAFRPRVDKDNRVKRSTVWLPFELRLPWHMPTSQAVGRLTQVKLAYSFDDGKTWIKATVHADGTRTVPNLPGYGKPFQEFVAKIKPTKKAKYVSLRVNAKDSRGNSVKQVIIHAYGLR